MATANPDPLSTSFDASFPPLPSRSSPPPIPPDPPPPIANPSLDKPLNSNSRSNPPDPQPSAFRSVADIPSTSNASFPSFTKKDYASLFTSLPRNAGAYQPKHFDIPRDGIPKEIPESVRSEGMQYWSNFLVGFFLDGFSSYSKVVNFLNRFWKLDGEVSIRSDGKHYFFKFSNDSDREKILKSDPIFIKGRMFIITKWDPSIGNSQAQIKKVPVWVHFYCIPTILWTLVGINWLACHVGRLICFDSSTEKLQRFRYAKALIEISSEFELPEKIVVAGLGKDCPSVKLSYDWQPKICTVCRVFGHSTGSCEFNNIAVNEVDKHAEDYVDNNVKTHDHPRQFNRKDTSNPNQGSWKFAKTNNSKFWRKKGPQNSHGAVNHKTNANNGTDMSNANANPFDALANEIDSNGATEVVNDNSNVNANTQQADLNVGSNSDAYNGFEAQVNITNEVGNHNKEQINMVEEMEDLVGNLFEENFANIDKSANGKPDMGSTFASCSSMSATGNLANSSISSTFATTSCTSTPLTSTPSKSSPYGSLKPPSNIQLPPPNVTGSGLTFPVVNSAMLSSAVPTSSLPTSKSKNKKPSGKFWADDDLNEGNDYMPEDVMPFSNKLKASRRHTRKNPLYDDFIT